MHFIFTFLLIRRPTTLQFIEKHGVAAAAPAAVACPQPYSSSCVSHFRCVIALFVCVVLILMVGRVNFYFCTNQMQQWKSIRWRTFNPVMEKWLQTRMWNRASGGDDDDDDGNGGGGGSCGVGIRITIPTFPLYAVIMCWSGEIALSLFSLHLFASHFETVVSFYLFLLCAFFSLSLSHSCNFCVWRVRSFILLLPVRNTMCRNNSACNIRCVTKSLSLLIA